MFLERILHLRGETRSGFQGAESAKPNQHMKVIVQIRLSLVDEPDLQKVCQYSILPVSLKGSESVTAASTSSALFQGHISQSRLIEALRNPRRNKCIFTSLGGDVEVGWRQGNTGRSSRPAARFDPSQTITSESLLRKSLADNHQLPLVQAYQ